MQATLGSKHSYLVTILAVAILCRGPMHGSDNFFTMIKKHFSSSLAFLLLNLIAAAIFLSNSRSLYIGKSNPFAEQFLHPLIRCQVLVEGASEGAATMDDVNRDDKGDFDACTPLALKEGHKQVDMVIHKDSDGGGVYHDVNGCSHDKNDDDDIDHVDLQKRSQEFIDRTKQEWRIENLRETG